ncbi:MAG: CPXCG motif-containing cysteine-rich protein [Woeseiaceae bacterium]|nr:CPXCG motif-containing cysteine-rich protein [Woeseiaceae bacterium]
MNPEKRISCPYCGEGITIIVDDSVPEQSYVEDCEVCCRPIEVHMTVDNDGDVVVDVRTDSE